MIRCKQEDCKYRNPKLGKTWDVNGCNYILITGKSKIAQMPEGEKYDIDTCPYYEKGRQKRRTMQNAFEFKNEKKIIEGSDILIEDVFTIELYERGYSDEDIAEIMNVDRRSVARWRKLEMIGTRNDPKQVINWNGVGKTLEEGYSVEAVSEMFNIKDDVIKAYKEARERE